MTFTDLLPTILRAPIRDGDVAFVRAYIETKIGESDLLQHARFCRDVLPVLARESARADTFPKFADLFLPILQAFDNQQRHRAHGNGTPKEYMLTVDTLVLVLHESALNLSRHTISYMLRIFNHRIRLSNGKMNLCPTYMILIDALDDACATFARTAVISKHVDALRWILGHAESEDTFLRAKAHCALYAAWNHGRVHDTHIDGMIEGHVDRYVQSFLDTNQS